MQLSVLVKPASGLCNMACRYCFYREEMEKRKGSPPSFMDETTLEHVIRKTLVNAGDGACFVFQGGEPTLCGLDFFRLAVGLETRYNRKKVPVTNCLQTNGLLLDDAWCSFLKEHDFLVGLSLDGLRDCHDRCRVAADGGPTFDKVFETACRLEKYGVRFNILTVLNSCTAPLIQDIYRFYRDRGWSFQQYMECLPTAGGTDAGGQELTLTPEAYGLCMDRLFSLWYRDWKKGRAPYIRQFENYVGIMLGIEPEACNQRGSCTIQYVIEADGSVYPCDFYAEDAYCLGNINRDRFRDLALGAAASRFLEESGSLPGACRDCSYAFLCRGGCRRLRISPARQKNYLCRGLQYFFDRNLEKIREISQILS